MTGLDDLIKHEKEYTGLDFKRTQYIRAMHEDLIKDIMCMANADIKGEKYIIIGVDYKNSTDRELIGIKKDEFINSANYQQLIQDNIEPQIFFDYFPHEIEGKCLGIFSISKCENPPYMMKKDYGSLKKGECFIRKGDSQFRMLREDFDRIIANKAKIIREITEEKNRKIDSLNKEADNLIGKLYSNLGNPLYFHSRSVALKPFYPNPAELKDTFHDFDKDSEFWRDVKKNLYLTTPETRKKIRGYLDIKLGKKSFGGDENNSRYQDYLKMITEAVEDRYKEIMEEIDKLES